MFEIFKLVKRNILIFKVYFERKIGYFCKQNMFLYLGMKLIALLKSINLKRVIRALKIIFQVNFKQQSEYFPKMKYFLFLLSRVFSLKNIILSS